MEFMGDSCMSSHGDMSLVVIDALYCSLPRAMRDLIDDNAPPFLVVETEIGLNDRSLLEVGRLPPRNSSLSAMGEFLASRLFRKLLMDRKPTFVVSASAVHLTQRSEYLAVITPDGLRSRLMGAVPS
jgi:hypothetical protein